MGTQNRQRRAAKAKKRAKERAGQRNRSQRSGAHPRGGGAPWGDGEGPVFTDTEIARYVLVAAASDRYENDGILGGSAVERLQALPRSVVDREAEASFVDQISAAWAGGWQPAELHRQIRRSLKSAARRLGMLAIAADLSARPAESLDERWQAQAEALELPPTNGARGFFAAWALTEGLDRHDALVGMLDALRCFFSLQALRVLLPPPGEDGRPPGPVAFDGPTSGALADPVLDKVRNLLAKAESSTFEAEATAFTAKAHELITRHAIDTALLGEQTAHANGPIMIRVPIDTPYVDAKSILLQVIAGSTRCQSVLHQGVDLATIAGFADDVAATELLFTSLLVQAQSALNEAARVAAPGAPERRSSYRSAFYLAYANRIGERLQEISHHVEADADAEAQAAGRGSVLPVLRARESAVDDLISEQFGDLTSMTVRGGRDAAGWGHGRVAADSAQLNFADLDDTADTGPNAAAPGDGHELG